MSKLSIDGVVYDTTIMNDSSKELANEIVKIEAMLSEKINIQAVLLKAKRAYIADLKTEMLSFKSGFDFGGDTGE